MRRNVAINDLGPEKKDVGDSELFQKEGKVRVNEGDAWWVSPLLAGVGRLTSCSALMYSHRDPQARVDIVDLDPYGTAAPFIDGAVQAVRDGGEVFLTGMDSKFIIGLRSPLRNVHGHVGPGGDQLP